MNWYASDYDKVKASESSFKSRKTIKLTCSFQQTYSIWPMLLACHFRINSFRKAATQMNSQQSEELKWEPDRVINEQQMFAGQLGSAIWIPEYMSLWNVFKKKKKAYCCQSPLLESPNTTPQNYLAVRTNSIPYEGKVSNKHIAFLSCYLCFDLIRKLLKTGILVKKTSERFLNLEMCICRVQKERRKLSYISRMLLFFFFPLKIS